MKTEQGLLNDCKFTAFINYEAVAASTPYVLVDLSDTTNYPHNHTGRVILHDIHVHAEVASSGVYDIWFGVISEVDASNGTAEWFEVLHLQSLASLLGFNDSINFGPLDCLIEDDAPVHFVTAAQQAGNTNWQTDTGLGSPAGAAGGDTGKPGPGDVVMWVEEVSGSGTIDFSVAVHYETL